MVLAELGSKITSALTNLSSKTVIDQEAIDMMLKEICNALMSADVNVKLVMTLRANMKAKLNFDEVAAGINKRKLVQRVVFEELCTLLDPKVKPYQPVKGRPNVVMFVGLQGSGKTTTVTKMAYHYKKKGWKAALVCADTFRAGAYDQLKQNATKVKIPFYGQYEETDPVKVAGDGVKYFKEEKFDIIFVDTSGRHKQEVELFEEMQQVAEVVKPDQIVFIMDSTIGQAAFDQAQAFKKSVNVGAVIITKMDSHAKGGGALSAVAATNSPIIFIGTGEHMEDFDPFVASTFVCKLLGMGDIPSLVNKIKEVIPNMENQTEMMERLQQGIFTMRDMYEQFENILKMGPLNKVMEMIPGFANFIQQSGSKVDANQKIKNWMTIMDSMTDPELDDNKVLQSKVQRDSRIHRIARGSGRSIKEVHELLEQFKHFEKMMSRMKGMKIPKNGNLQGRNLQQVAQMLPPNVMKQMGGLGNVQNLLKSMGGMNMSSLKGMMGMGGDG